MNRLYSLVAAASLALCGTALIGCESHNPSNLPPDERGAYEGGNGAFGENPAQPGERSQQHFENSTASPSTQPNSDYNH